MANDQSDSNNIPRLRAAYLRVSTEIAAVPDDQKATINMDILVSTTMVMGALPQIMALRPQFVSHLPLFNLRLLDGLEDYTLAATHAHTQYLGADTPAEDIPELFDEVVDKRDVVVTDATALTKRGYLNPARLQELKGSNGHRNAASDLLTVCGVLRDGWDKIQGKTGITLEELDEAESLGYRLLNAIGYRDQAPATVLAVAQTRQKAYTLFVHAYDQVRRGVCYIRWDDGDADDIAPSLYAGRGGRKKTAPDAKKEPEAALKPNIAPAAATPAPQAVAPGLPGADPFIR